MVNVIDLSRAGKTAVHEYAPDLLRHEHFLIYPYLRGSIYPPDTLYALYRAIAAEPPGLGRVLYEAPRLDLEAFMEYFGQTLLFLAVTPDQQTILGALWFTALTTHKAQIGLWFTRQVWGAPARSIARRVVEFTFIIYKWRTIFGLSPWKAVVPFARDCGFTLLATVPGFVETRTGRLLPLYVVARQNTPFTLGY